MAGFVYKPQTRKGPVFLSPVAGSAPTIKLADGRTVKAVRGDQAGGVFQGHEGFQWVFPKDVLGQQGATLLFNGQSQPLGNTNMSYRGGSFGSLSESSKGALGDFSSMGGFGGGMGGFAPMQVGPYGFGPANLMGSYPSPFLASYSPIQTAPYNFTDVKKFAKEFGQLNRDELAKNFQQSKGFALDTLNAELESLAGYIPAMTALKRKELSADQQFNQQMRTEQLDATLPGVRGQLSSQGQRAETYAQGRLPDTLQDRAFELGVRSNAADMAAAGGFGVRSSVARKASDLMSAKERLQVSQYGDQLLSNNINQRANIELAPTSYSNAGQQISVTPPVPFSQLSQNSFGQVNAATLMPTPTAFSGQVQQNQFTTQLEQGTRQFNAANQLQTSMFNAGIQNQFALGQFGYGASLAGVYAGAAQTSLNTGIGLQQQAQSQGIFQDYLSSTQSANQIGSIAQGIGTLATAANTLFGDGGAASDLFSGSIDSGGSAGSSYSPSRTPSIDITDSGTNINVPDFSLDGGSVGATPSISVGSSGTDISIPDFSLDAGQSSELSLRSSFAPRVAQAVADTSSAILQTAGISNTPQPNYIPLGYNTRGATTYADPTLLTSEDSSVGPAMVDSVRNVVAPLRVLAPEDEANLSSIANNLGNASIMASLTDAVVSKDKKAFIDTALNITKAPAAEYAAGQFDDPVAKSQALGGVASAYTAAQLYENWGQMSPAQKSLGLAALAISGYRTVDGTNLAAKPIIKPVVQNGEVVQPGITVGQGLALMSAGYNTYSLVDNWGDFNTLQQVAGVTGNASQIAALAKSMDMLGYGTTGAAVPGVTANTLSSIGATAAPEFGVGAISIPAGTSVPAGYTSVATSQGASTIAVPTPNAASAAPGLLETAGGIAGIAAGAYTVYQGWGGRGTSGATTGLLGGSAIAAGLSTLGYTNPYLLGGVVAASLISNVTGSGKPASQQNRDAIRSRFKEVGLADNDFNVVLADGTKANIGVDGGGDRHQVTNPDALLPKHKGRKLYAYDVDYTNDLDFSASMAGITLSRLLTGGVAKHTDQVGGQLANASLKNVGFNQQMTKENYEKVMQNQRAFYSQAGIKSRDDALQLANMAFAEKRVSAIEHSSMLQSIDMVFNNNSYDLAKKLMAGRMSGVQAAAKIPSGEEPTVPEPSDKAATTFKPQPNNFRPVFTKEELRLNNAKKTFRNYQNSLGATAA